MRVSVFVGVSIDGFLARENGTYDFLEPFEGEEHGFNEFFRSIDALVIGRATYETVLALGAWQVTRRTWPHPQRTSPQL